MKKFLFIILIILLNFSLISETEHEELINDYQELINDYQELLNDYEELLSAYELLNNNYIEKINSYEKLNDLYLSEVDIHELSMNALNKAKESIKHLQYLLNLKNDYFFAIIPQIGFSGNDTVIGIGALIDIPILPINILFNTDFLNYNPKPFSFKIGIGFQF